ncbi:MAG: COG4280 domain-containing protein, partial [Roseiflexaceae bacterium]
AVEMVEALTIVLATGITRGWRSALLGTGVALVALAVIVVILGPAIALVPIHVMQIVVGALMLIFGLQWLRKAILRAAGRKAMHDEDAIFAAEQAEARKHQQDASAPIDWYSFTICFKGVFLEGLEVAFITITFGVAQQQLDLAIYGAVAAFVLICLAGVFLHRPLSQVPENTLKYVVGLLLTSFGTFWSAEGVGVEWPGTDVALFGLLLFYTLVAYGLVRILRMSPNASIV